MPADAPVYVTVKPAAAAPVTVAPPAKPAIALIAAWMFAFEYAWLAPPITADSWPPIRTWKGDEYVAVPPPELARPVAATVYSKLRGVGTAVIVTVPL